MNALWLKIVFIVSLSLNCMIAGGLAYRYAFEREPAPVNEEALPPEIADLPAQVRSARRGLGMQLRQARMDLIQDRANLLNLLIQEPPDMAAINTAVDSLSSRQAAIEKQVLGQIIKEIHGLPPEQKTAYLKGLRGRMHRHGKFGLRPGRQGGRRPGAW